MQPCPTCGHCPTCGRSGQMLNLVPGLVSSSQSVSATTTQPNLGADPYAPAELPPQFKDLYKEKK